jgi:hypothetical protein
MFVRLKHPLDRGKMVKATLKFENAGTVEIEYPIAAIGAAAPNAAAVANNFGNSFLTTGTINPGVIWVGSYFQVGLEAQVPVNSASGHGIGVLGQLHLYLDDIFPTTIGQPLLGGTSTAPRKLTF